MARKPEWFAQIEGIRERLSSLHPEATLVRVDVETLFSVKRTEATRIFQIAGGIGLGRGQTALITAGHLLRYVESRQGEVKKERKRRAAFAQVVAEEAAISPARHSNFKLPKVPSFDELGDAVSFRAGEMKVKYESFEDLMSKLVSLGKAGLHQSDKFQEMVESGLSVSVE